VSSRLPANSTSNRWVMLRQWFFTTACGAAMGSCDPKTRTRQNPYTTGQTHYRPVKKRRAGVTPLGSGLFGDCRLVVAAARGQPDVLRADHGSLLAGSLRPAYGAVGPAASRREVNLGRDRWKFDSRCVPSRPFPGTPRSSNTRQHASLVVTPRPRSSAAIANSQNATLTTG
jgi:hypothetical protein